MPHRARMWEDVVPEKRIVLFVSMSVVLVMLLAGCTSREERITLTNATAASETTAAASGETATARGTATLPATATATITIAARTAEAQRSGSATPATPTLPPTQEPTPTPTPTSFGPPPNGLAVVTFDEGGRTALLQSGDRLILTLGDGYVWHLRVSGVEVLVPLATSMLPPGTQAVFQARKAGKAVVGAVGEPVCRPGWTNCPTAVVQFELTVIVAD